MQSTNNKAFITMSEDVFFEVFKPIRNHIDDNASWDGCMFETFGDELEFVRRQPAERIWTIFEADDGLAISNGYHLVNRIGYLVSRIASEAETDYEITIEQAHSHWPWEDAFDKFGFEDGDGTIHTHEVARAIANLGYMVTQMRWGMHNTVITSIKDASGLEQIPTDTRIGYESPRSYLSEAIILHLDRVFGSISAPVG